jgi:hypothetical protein
MRNRTLEENLDDFKESIQGYITARFNLVKLILLEKISKAATYLFSVVLGIVVIASSMLLLTLAFSFWYGSAHGSVSGGFLIAAIFYAVAGLIVYLLRHKIFTDNIIRNIGKILFRNDEDEDEK